VPDDRPPFEDLYRDYLGRIYAYVRAQVLTAADAEDITAQVFMNAYQAYGRFEARNTSPVAWLFRIARNATTDHFRAHGRRERLRRTIEHQPIAEADPGTMAEERLQYKALLVHAGLDRVAPLRLELRGGRRSHELHRGRCEDALSPRPESPARVGA